MKKEVQSVDQYIAAQPAEGRILLESIRQTIRKALPQAEELMSYSMPAFRYHGIVAWYALAKNHCALYVRPATMKPFLDELKAYSLSKSAIRFPLNGKIPLRLITKIVKHAAASNATAASLKAKNKS